MKESEQTTKPVWGPQQATAMNDPDASLIYNGILKSGDPIIKDSNKSVALYYESMSDDQVISTFNQRKRAVIAAPLSVEPGGDAPIDIECAEAFKENLSLLRMDDITDKQLNSIYLGYSPQENLWRPHEGQIWLRGIKTRKSERFVYDADHKLRMLTRAEPIKGVETDPVYFWSLSVGALSHDNPYGLGLGYYLYWLTRFKKSGIKFWLKYLEKFAQPTIVGRFPPSADQAEVNKLLATIRALSSDFGAAIPEDMIIEMIEAKRSGTADYKSFREMANASISKVVVGQTMTTDDGASNSQSKTHDKTKTNNARGDADIWAEQFNASVSKPWQELNYPLAKPPKVSRDVEPKQSTIELAKTDVEIDKLGWKLTEEKFTERYGGGYERKPDVQPIDGGSTLDVENDEDPIDKEDEPEDFSENSSIDQDLIDEALEQFIDNEGIRVSEDMLTDLLEFASTHTPQETLDQLPKLVTEQNVQSIEENLGKAMIGAATVGIENA